MASVYLAIHHVKTATDLKLQIVYPVILTWCIKGVDVLMLMSVRMGFILLPIYMEEKWAENALRKLDKSFIHVTVLHFGNWSTNLRFICHGWTHQKLANEGREHLHFFFWWGGVKPGFVLRGIKTADSIKEMGFFRMSHAQVSSSNPLISGDKLISW